MKRIAAPMVGGIVTSTLMELVVYPAIYLVWIRRQLVAGRQPSGAPAGQETIKPESRS